MGQREKDYFRYKAYQRRHQFILDLAETPHLLADLTHEQVLKLYACVEKIYMMRLSYALKYVAESDEGHVLYMKYIQDVLRLYQQVLSQALTRPAPAEPVPTPAYMLLLDLPDSSDPDPDSDPVPNPEECPTTTQISNPTPESAAPATKKKRKKSKRRRARRPGRPATSAEDKHQWNVEIPRMIAQNRKELKVRTRCIRSVQDRLGLDTEPETVHVMQYLLIAFGMVSHSRVSLLPKTIEIKPYPLVIDEFAKTWGTGELKLISVFVEYLDDELFQVVETVLEVAEQNPRWTLHHIPLIKQTPTVALIPSALSVYCSHDSAYKTVICLRKKKQYRIRCLDDDDQLPQCG